jgi:hypothetical protein
MWGPRPARHRSRLPARASQWQAGSGEAGGGILLRGRLSEDHRGILSVQALLNYTTNTAGGFGNH